MKQFLLNVLLLVALIAFGFGFGYTAAAIVGWAVPPVAPGPDAGFDWDRYDTDCFPHPSPWDTDRHPYRSC